MERAGHNQKPVEMFRASSIGHVGCADSRHTPPSPFLSLSPDSGQTPGSREAVCQSLVSGQGRQSLAGRGGASRRVTVLCLTFAWAYFFFLEPTFGEGFIRDRRRAGSRGIDAHEEGKRERSGAEMEGAGLPARRTAPGAVPGAVPRWRAWCDGMRRWERTPGSRWRGSRLRRLAMRLAAHRQIPGPTAPGC